jgi:hypothetical protein
MGSGNDHPTAVSALPPVASLPLGLSGNKPLALSSAITTDSRSLIVSGKIIGAGAAFRRRGLLKLGIASMAGEDHLRS